MNREVPGASAGQPAPLRTFEVERLRVRVYANRAEAGRAAGLDVAACMREVMARKAEAAMIFAAGKSQNEMLATLRADPDLDWQRVVAFDMDEYVGLPATAPGRFCAFLAEALFDAVRPGKVYCVDGDTPDLAQEAVRYTALLAQHPVDIVCLGVGETGHIAFNDPPYADFADPHTLKLVTLDEGSRVQQIHDGCFAVLDEVPRQALTLTVPALMSGRQLRCVAPGPTKARAVRAMLEGEVTPLCPASILRRHGDCVMYLDVDSAALLERA